MTLNQVFSAPRFFNLFKEETSSGNRMTFIVASVVFVFLLIIFTLNAGDHSNVEFHKVWYPIILLAGGFYFTSTSFNELNRKEERMNYLSIPASIFEKFTMKLLITTLGYVVGVTLLYWIFSKQMNLIAQNYFEFSYNDFNPFDDFYLFIIKLYVVIQSLFILGAATFNRFSFFKTLFALGLVQLTLTLFCAIAFRIVFAEYFESFLMPDEDTRVVPNLEFREYMEHTAWPLLQNVFWYVLAPVLWVIAYFKLKEREV